ncbi:hypothetical protein M758_UG061800 [Ceratodon purpureus]|nr:hypothetical protein M758_UG061800 [Ceratodon purpureus]
MKTDCFTFILLASVYFSGYNFVAEPTKWVPSTEWTTPMQSLQLLWPEKKTLLWNTRAHAPTCTLCTYFS